MTVAASSVAASPDLIAAIDLARATLIAVPPPGTKRRARILWAAAKQARALGDGKKIHAAFMALAVDVNLINKRGHWTGADVRETARRRGAEDLSHTIVWALRGRNPFEKGPL